MDQLNLELKKRDNSKFTSKYGESLNEEGYFSLKKNNFLFKI